MSTPTNNHRSYLPHLGQYGRTAVILGTVALVAFYTTERQLLPFNFSKEQSESLPAWAERLPEPLSAFRRMIVAALVMLAASARSGSPSVAATRAALIAVAAPVAAALVNCTLNYAHSYGDVTFQAGAIHILFVVSLSVAWMTALNTAPVAIVFVAVASLLSPTRSARRDDDA